jgi:hypothetical protein
MMGIASTPLRARAPTDDANIENGKWQIMPAFGVAGFASPSRGCEAIV